MPSGLLEERKISSQTRSLKHILQARNAQFREKGRGGVRAINPQESRHEKFVSNLQTIFISSPKSLLFNISESRITF